MKKFAATAMLLFSVMLANAQHVDATWESIRNRPYPQWFSDAKLGIFIHWGVYSVPAYAGKEQYGEWFYKGLISGDSLRTSFMKKNYGKNFRYEDFEKLFTAELFDADQWADLFARSGARYVLLVTKHHDGYCLWNSRYSPNWNSVTGTPKRDIVAELTQAVRGRNMKMGFYYSLPEWNNRLHRWTVDPHDSIGKYVERHMIPQFKELVSEYKPSVIFSDGEWFNSAEQWHSAELISWYYNTVGPEAIVNDRWGGGSDCGFRTPEYSAGITVTDRPWAECRGLGRSFGLNRNEPLENYMSSTQLIRHFVKLVAAGGGMTLNVGPSADGQIPLLQQERLIDLGKWLETNGEAIYGSRPYTKFHEEKEVSISRTDSMIDFDWVRNSPDKAISYDNFTAEWTGFIEAPETAKYTFEVEVDDAAKIEIDGETVICFDPRKSSAAEGNAQEAANFNKQKGLKRLVGGKRYPIRISYRENNLEARMKLFWSTSEDNKRIISPEHFHLTENGEGHGLSACYRCLQPYVCYTTNGGNLYAIAIEYPQDSLVLDIPLPQNNIEVEMLGCEKKLPWKHRDGKLIIDTTPIKYNDLTNHSAWVFRLSRFFN